MTIKVLMVPHVTELGDSVTGISRVVEAYYKHLPAFDIEMVDRDATSYDVKAAHAGITRGDCDVCHCHGLHWTGCYQAPKWEYSVNEMVIAAIRNAREVTVPSPWVAKAFQRDMRFTPHIIPHGIDWDDWQQPDVTVADYVLYNKNRQGDVCDAGPVVDLAALVPSVRFLTTFVPPGRQLTPNVKVSGLLSPNSMKKIVQGANVYLAITQETFGIGILEAMASGVPVLAYDYGGASLLVQHGVTGYLARPDNLDDLVVGLAYCIEHRHVLGENGRKAAKQWTWDNSCKMVADVYASTMIDEPATVAVIIPCYNYSALVGDAIRSVSEQTYDKLIDIIVVDDGSADSEQTKQVVSDLAQGDGRIQYIYQQNMGVAHARNHGIALTSAKYITCLDADDRIFPAFLEKLIPPLEKDSTLGIAYSGLALQYEKNIAHGKWPTDFDYDGQIQGHNQVPTCCVFRRKAWERLGGYRQRYADPAIGCGAEDAEFWLRVGSIGYDAKKVVDEDLFLYRLGGSTQQAGFKDAGKWLDWHPWTEDKVHPFASVATPALISHQVNHYDDPLVSVIIPVGVGHERHIIQALDSVEAQTVRRWEAIVVWDTGDDIPEELMIAYPYVNWLPSSDVVVGTGASRNDGADVAIAPYLLFLDADDYLLPNALEEFLRSCNDIPIIAYSESLGVRAVDKAGADQYEVRKELLKYENGVAVFRQPVADYVYDLAVQQPYTKKPYFWCYITSLVPKVWHDEVGGFDETLETWEDWDYWIRLAKAGKPFKAIHTPLITYNYDTGHRREYGVSVKRDVMDLLKTKHEEVQIMACSGCGKSRSVRGSNPINSRLQRVQSPAGLNDDDFVMCTYARNKKGSHSVIGTTIFSNRLTDRMRRVRNGWAFDYGYHSGGEVFPVHCRDMESSDWFVVAEQASTTVAVPVADIVVQKPPKPVEVPSKPAMSAPSLVVRDADVVVNEIISSSAVDLTAFDDERFDLQTLPSVTAILARKLTDAGLTTPDLIAEAGIDKLMQVKGIGSDRAKRIMDAVENLQTPKLSQDEALAELGRLLGE